RSRPDAADGGEFYSARTLWHAGRGRRASVVFSFAAVGLRDRTCAVSDGRVLRVAQAGQCYPCFLHSPFAGTAQPWPACPIFPRSLHVALRRSETTKTRSAMSDKLQFVVGFGRRSPHQATTN